MRLRLSLARAVLALGCVYATTALRAMSVIAPTFDELVGSAELVVRGVVTDVHCVTVDTSQGPAIKTLVTLRVERALKGTPSGDVTLWFLGGTVGRRTLTVIGMPTFKVGAREIVFAAHNGRALCPLVAAGYGRYHVRHDAAANRDYVTRDNNVPLVSTGQVVQALDQTTGRLPSPADGMTVEAFEARIAAVVSGLQRPVQP